MIPDKQDPVSAMHDTEAEQGEEEATDDAFELDSSEAEELGANLDTVDDPEARLN